MDDHAKSCEQVFSAAKSEFKSLDYFYFHNCVYENIWKNNNRRHSEYLETENLLRTYSKNTKLINTSDDIFSLKKLPKRMVIEGGGYIAIEFAFIFANLGVKVDLVYRGKQIL